MDSQNKKIKFLDYFSDNEYISQHAPYIWREATVKVQKKTLCWIFTIFFMLLLTGCVSLSTPSHSFSKSYSKSYVATSHFVKHWGWSRVLEKTPSTFRAGKHKIFFELGTNYAQIDGKTVDLKKPLYSLNGEVYVPYLFIKKYSYLKNTFPSPAPSEREAKKIASSSPPPSPSFSPFPATYLPKKKKKIHIQWKPKPRRYKFRGSYKSFPYKLKFPRHSWKFIVIHHSSTEAGNARIFHRYHKNHRHWINGLGYHFVIGNGSKSINGQVEIGPRWAKQQAGAHAGSMKYNKYGIGICLVGNFQHHYPSSIQLKSLVKLTKKLMKRYHIPIKNVLPHSKVRRGPTSCPGKSFPWKTFIRRLH